MRVARKKGKLSGILKMTLSRVLLDVGQDGGWAGAASAHLGA